MDAYVPLVLVPTVLFLLIVAPTWIFMHYRSKQRLASAMSDQERADLEELMAQAERMVERIATLESILDAETPDWRKRLENN